MFVLFISAPYIFSLVAVVAGAVRQMRKKDGTFTIVSAGYRPLLKYSAYSNIQSKI